LCSTVRLREQVIYDGLPVFVLFQLVFGDLCLVGGEKGVDALDHGIRPVKPMAVEHSYGFSPTDTKERRRIDKAVAACETLALEPGVAGRVAAGTRAPIRNVKIPIRDA
jgi:hypothetical protein